jgi:hypothetical protein
MIGRDYLDNFNGNTLSQFAAFRLQEVRNIDNLLGGGGRTSRPIGWHATA